MYSRRLPDFLIIGAQKAGTSWLQTVLRHHPHVFMPSGETPFFEDPDYGLHRLEDLCAQVSRAPASALAGIKRPTDLTHKECAARIARDLPHAKLIAILRDPVERAVSAYYHSMRLGLRPVVNADEGLRAAIDSYSRAADPTDLLGHGLYSEAIERYYSHLPRERLLLLSYSSLKRNPRQCVDTVCDFLSISRNYRDGDLTATVNVGTYDPNFLRPEQWLNRRRYVVDTRAGRTHDSSGPGHYAASFLARIVHRLGISMQRPDGGFITQDTRNRLAEFYRRDQERLKELTGIELN
jgi:hypothetical protein